MEKIYLMKKLLIILGLLVISGAAVAVAMSGTSEEGSKNKAYGWHYKMTVEVGTPEGVKTGSAVRQMGNGLVGSPLSQAGNPTDVRGEAVVVDLGERGVLFALISHKSDFEFYDTFPEPNGKGGATPEAVKYYDALPIGTKGVLNPGMPGGSPKLVTFTDMDDPKSVILIQEWERTKGQPLGQQWVLQSDRMEELFGEGVRLKQITLEITDEPVTWRGVDDYLPWLKSIKANIDGTRVTTSNELYNKIHLGNFIRGDKK